MDVLLKAHPLYPELLRLDEDGSVMESRARALSARSGDAIRQEEQAMRRDLQSAENRARKELAERQSAYTAQENAAISFLLTQNVVPRQSADAIAEQIAQTSDEQARNVGEQAKKNLQAYRLGAIAQSEGALASVHVFLRDRADRAYRMQADAYEQQEAAFTLEQAQKDAAEHLLLRAQLADLALDKQARAQTQARLDGLDERERDEREEAFHRDQAALASYRGRLHDLMREQEAEERRKTEGRTNAMISERSRQVETNVLGRLASVAAPSPAPASEGLTPLLRRRLDAFHKRHQKTYVEDVEQTVREFAEISKKISARFERLAGIDAAAQESVEQEIAQMRKQRENLYGQIVAQINRQIKVAAKRRGMENATIKNGVFSGGVDFTGDVARSLESLHE